MGVRKIQNAILRVGPFKFPIAILTASDRNGGLKFQTVHGTDGGALRSTKTCAICNKEVATADTAKRYTFEDGLSVDVDAGDFSDAFGNPSRNMSIRRFVPLANVNPTLLEKSYYIIPGDLRDEGYSAFVEALHRSGAGGVVNLFFHGAEHLGIVRAISPKELIVQQVEYPENLRSPKEVANIVDAEDDTIELMEDFIEALTDVNSTLVEYKDNFSGRMKKVLDEKRKRLAGAATIPAEEDIDEDMTIEDIKELLRSLKRPPVVE